MTGKLPIIDGEFVHITWYINDTDNPTQIRAVVDGMSTGTEFFSTLWCPYATEQEYQDFIQWSGYTLRQWITTHCDSYGVDHE